MDSGARARRCARIADDKKAEDIVILDLRGLTFIADYFVIATAGNPRQGHAIADGIEKEMSELGEHCIGRSGYHDARWILLDYVDVVVHLFDPGARSLYDLEMLWGDAPRVDWQAGQGQD